MSTLLVIDIGGTSVKTGFVVDGAPHSCVRLFPSTQLRTSRPIDALATMVATVLAEASLKPDGIVATVPGFLDSSAQRVLFAANVPELNGCALVHDLQRSTGIPVTLERDVVLSLMGEYVAGACKQSSSVLGMFFGTGVGAAYLEAGKPFRGSGWALEIGHMPYQGARRWLGEERTACLEAFVSGKVLESIATEHAVHVGEVFTAALRNAALREHADDFVLNQANAVATAIAILSPKAIVLGGGICEMRDFPKDRLIAGIQSSFPFAQTGQTPDVRWAHLGWKGVLHGASLLAGEKQSKPE